MTRWEYVGGTGPTQPWHSKKRNDPLVHPTNQHVIWVRKTRLSSWDVAKPPTRPETIDQRMCEVRTSGANQQRVSTQKPRTPAGRESMVKPASLGRKLLYRKWPGGKPTPHEFQKVCLGMSRPLGMEDHSGQKEPLLIEI